MKKVEEFIRSILECKICYESEPLQITLPCGHHICEVCLKRLRKKTSVDCPYCNVPLPIPQLGFAPFFERISIKDLLNAEHTQPCPSHAFYALEFKCSTCVSRPSVCIQCFYDSHIGHVLERVESAEAPSLSSSDAVPRRPETRPGPELDVPETSAQVRLWSEKFKLLARVCRDRDGDGGSCELEEGFVVTCRDGSAVKLGEWLKLQR